jgi:hypothetical protein
VKNLVRIARALLAKLAKTAKVLVKQLVKRVVKIAKEHV